MFSRQHGAEGWCLDDCLLFSFFARKSFVDD